MEQLHAAVGAGRRRRNPRILTPCPPPVPLAQARCRSCGQPIGAGVEPGALGALIAARRCLGCYLREAA